MAAMNKVKVKMMKRLLRARAKPNTKGQGQKLGQGQGQGQNHKLLFTPKIFNKLLLKLFMMNAHLVVVI